MIGNPALPAAHKAATISDAFLNPGGTQAKHGNCGRRVGARSCDAAVLSPAIRRHKRASRSPNGTGNGIDVHDRMRRHDPRWSRALLDSAQSPLPFHARRRGRYWDGLRQPGNDGNVLCSSSTFACHSMTNGHKPANRSIAVAVCADTPTGDCNGHHDGAVPYAIGRSR